MVDLGLRQRRVGIEKIAGAAHKRDISAALDGDLLRLLVRRAGVINKLSLIHI